MNSLSLSGDLHETMDALDDALDTLRAQLSACQVDACRAFDLPPVTPEDELLEPDYIEPLPFTAAEAVAAVLAAFGRFHTGAGLSTRIVYRMPGVIAISTPSPDTLVSQVQKINLLKNHFDAVAQTVRDPDERFDLIHRNFPGVVYLQVIRELKVITDPLKSVTFSWGRKPSSQLITPESADSKLEWTAKHPNSRVLSRSGLSLNQLQETVARERSYLATLPAETKIRFRRELRVRPLSNLLFTDDIEVTKSQREAHTPLIVINSPNVKIGELKPYDAAKRGQRKPRHDSRAKGRPLSRVLPLFLE